MPNRVETVEVTSTANDAFDARRAALRALRFTLLPGPRCPLRPLMRAPRCLLMMPHDG